MYRLLPLVWVRARLDNYSSKRTILKNNTSRHLHCHCSLPLLTATYNEKSNLTRFKYELTWTEKIDEEKPIPTMRKVLFQPAVSTMPFRRPLPRFQLIRCFALKTV
ncbi:unnamed protein product, partial [Mesorhabditis belari]|uniref:Uncharacterized protein n=1 Tax=Mesorhabditis belari TaxID=2138241 RepID=A0AAF3J5V1_9BILA